MVRGGYTKDQIEDITGGVPLFLDNCVLKDEKGRLFMSLNTPLLSETYAQAWRYERRIRSECGKNTIDLNLYATRSRFTSTTSLTSLVTTNI